MDEAYYRNEQNKKKRKDTVQQKGNGKKKRIHLSVALKKLACHYGQSFFFCFSSSN